MFFDLLALSGLPLLAITELGGDMVLVLKIFIMLTVIAFVTQHLGKGPLAVGVILVVAWFILFNNFFWFFGGAYMLYMFLMLGFGAVLVDFFFVNPHGSGAPDSPMSSGKDFAARQSQIQQMMRR